MAQSVELLLDADAEEALVGEWALLRDAGLPTEWRTAPSPSHRPHITLYAGAGLNPGAEEALPALVAGLALPLEIGDPLCFPMRGFPGRAGQWVLVRQVVTTVALLQLQARVAELCGAGLGSHFGPGRFTPHVTLARRMTGSQVGAALDLLASSRGRTQALVTRARRWDGTAKRDWLL